MADTNQLTSNSGPTTNESPTPRHAATAAVILASLGFFVITLDVSIVNLALPSIQADLGGGTNSQQWILDGYTLFFAALLLCSGNLSDRFGAKRSYVVGIALFAVASLGCALAPTTAWLIAARCVQGITAALMLPPSMTLIREAIPEAKARARALGIWAAGGAVASAAGPVLGGTLATYDWRLIFAINVPICALMLVLARWVKTSPRNGVPFDWAGQILALIGLGSLVFGLIEGGVIGYENPVIIALLAVGVAALAAFVLAQAKGAHPMMPLALFRQGAMRVAFFGGFTFIYCWFGSVFIASLYLQQELGISAALAGLVFLPSAICSFFGNLVSGPLANRYGTRFPVLLGMGSLVVGLVSLALIAPLGSPVLTGLALILIGAGGSVAMPPLAGVILEYAPEGQAGVASAVSNTFRQVGGALAVALFGVIITHNPSFISGMQLALATGAVLATGCLLASLSLPGRGTSGGGTDRPADPR